MTTATCPDDETLVRLLAGLLPADSAEFHEQHLAHCADCLARAERLTAHDSLMESLCATPGGDDTISAAEEPVVRALIERLSGLSDAPLFKPTLSDDELRSLLSPPQQDGELGRLGPFRVLEILGVGGMGVVFRAEDMPLGRIVALKAMKPQLAASRAACERFRREACAAASFEHNHVVTIYQVGEERGIPFFSMELLEGESLRSRLQREGSLPVREVIRIGREIAEGLAAAHRRGPLHRDIKPDNIWLESEHGQVKIVDFGLVCAVDQRSSLTHSGTILGTPHYMAPEQVCGEAVDERCDLFSLGSLLYHLATGQPPFAGSNLFATLVAVSQQDVSPPHVLNPQLPRELSDVIMQLLAKQPENRIQTASEVVRRLGQIERGLSTGEIAVAAQPPRRRIRRWLSVGGFAAALLLAVVVYVITDKGTLVIEADDSVAVTVEAGEVKIQDKASGRQFGVSVGENALRPGEYEIVAAELPAGVQFSAREFSIHRGKEQRIRISLRSGPLAAEAKPSSASTSAKAEPPKTETLGTVETVESLVVQPGQPISPFVLVREPAVLPGVHAWTVETTEQRSEVTLIVFSPDGRRVATSGYDGVVRIWDPENRTLQKMIVCPRRVQDICWSPDGTSLATTHPEGSEANQGDVCVWRIEPDVKCVRRFRRAAWQVRWSPDGRTLCGVEPGPTTFWNTDSGEIIAKLPTGYGLIRQPWSADGRTFAYTNNEQIKLWDAAKNLTTTLPVTNCTTAAWSPRGFQIAALRHLPNKSVQIEVWDATQGTQMHAITVKSQATARGSFSWSPDGTTIAVHTGDTVDLWDVASRERRRQLAVLDESLEQPLVDWDSTGRYIAYLDGGVAKLWDSSIETSLRLTGLSEHTSLLADGFAARQGLLFLQTGSVGSPRRELWDLNVPKPVILCDDMRQVALSPDGQRLAVLRQEETTSPLEIELSIYEVSGANLLHSLKLPLPAEVQLIWSPDCNRLAVTRPAPTFLGDRSGFVTVIDALRGAILCALGEPTERRRISKLPREVNSLEAARCAAWSPDSTRLAYWDSGRTVAIVQAETGEVLHRLTAPDAENRLRPFENRDRLLESVFEIGWSESGGRLAYREYVSNENSKIVFWDLADSAPQFWAAIQLQRRMAGGERSFDLAPDGKQVLVRANGLEVWSIETGQRKASLDSASTMNLFRWLSNGSDVAFREGATLGIWTVATGAIRRQPDTFWHVDRLRGVTAFHDDLIGTATPWGVAFWDRNLVLQSSLVLDPRSSSRALVIRSDGKYRTSPGAEEPRFVAMAGQEQRLLTPEEFAKQYGWKNDPDAAFLGRGSP